MRVRRSVVPSDQPAEEPPPARGDLDGLLPMLAADRTIGHVANQVQGFAFSVVLSAELEQVIVP